MNSPAHDLALFLEDANVGTFGGTTEWAIAVAAEPETPGSVVTLYDTGGSGPDTDALDEFVSSVQIRVRGADFPAAYAKQEEIRDLLIYTQPLQLESSVARVVMTSSILSLGRDDTNRFLLTANYEARRVAP